VSSGDLNPPELAEAIGAKGTMRTLDLPGEFRQP
jgi:hypothetical protein